MRASLRATARAALLVAPLLTGCASHNAELASAVPADLTAGDAAPIAAAVTDLATRRVPASAGALHVLAPVGDTVLTPALLTSLRAAGYTVADGGTNRLAYQVTGLDRDVLVRVDLNGARAARLFTRSSRGLAAAGAFTVREREPEGAAR